MGEIFNPVRDCPDVVDKLPEAKDGYYWITLPKGTNFKVCLHLTIKLGSSLELTLLEILIFIIC